MAVKQRVKSEQPNIAELTHDSVFKDLFGTREFRIAFLQKYLPQDLTDTIQWSSFTIYNMNVEHVRQQDKHNMKNKEQSDMAFLFRFRGGEKGMLFCHIENQTTADSTIVLRSLHYQTSLLLDYLKSNKKHKLPLVFSIIYYANKKPFPYSHNIYDYFADPELARRYAFKSSFVDLSLVDDQELLMHPFLSGYELIFKHIRHGDIDHSLKAISSKLQVYDQFSRRTLIKYMSRYVNMQPLEFCDAMKL